MSEALQKIAGILIPSARIEAQDLPGPENIRLYLINNDYPGGKLSDEIIHALMEDPPYWIFCWASGKALASWILKRPDFVKGKRVLDFGCGSGVTAIAAKRAGAREVVALDNDPHALAATEKNAVLNSVDIKTAATLDGIDLPFDILFAADILYDRENYPLLEEFNKLAPLVIVADTRVKEFPHRDYRLINERRETTFPDLGESDEFNRVRIYCRGNLSVDCSLNLRL
jgi:predicted nicotinamide N-methyase